MNGSNFTERVRSVLALARTEAQRLKHPYVGTEHLLLGLLAEGKGLACEVLADLHVDPRGLVQRVEQSVGTGSTAAAGGLELPYTSRAKKVLELAMTEARNLKHSYVGTEHLLLGLLSEEKGIGAQVLGDFGVTLRSARVTTLKLLGAPAPRADAPPPSPEGEPSSIVVTFQYPNGASEVFRFSSAITAISYLQSHESGGP